MTRSHLRLVLLSSVVVLAACQPSAPESDGDGISDAGGDGDDEGGLEPFTAIPVGEDGLTYADLDQEEMLAWGPTAYVVDGDGLHWIADGPGRRVVAFGDDAVLETAVDLEARVSRIQDIAISDEFLYVLETGAETASLLRIQRTAGGGVPADDQVEVFALPEALQVAKGLTGIHRMQDGTLAAELEFGAGVVQLLDAGGAFAVAPLDGYAVGGHTVRFETDAADPNAVAASLLVDGMERAEITVPGTFAGARFVDAAGPDSLHVLIDSISTDGESVVVHTIMRTYGLDGALIGEVLLPTEDDVVHVEHSVAVGPDGVAVHLATHRDEVVLATLEPSAGDALPPATHPLVLLDGPGSDRLGQAPDHQAANCLSGAEILDIADTYASYENTYSSDNYYDTCYARTRPSSHFKPGKVTKGVAYSWGKFDSISHYDSSVSNGDPVGDIKGNSDGGVDGCSHGVDCSGFVSRTWDTPHKYGTSTIHQTSHNLGGFGQMIPGDAFNKSGSHIMLFVESAQNGFVVYESTTGGYQRVIRRTISAGYASGYKPIRFDDHCGYYGEDPEPPKPECDDECVQGATCAGDNIKTCADFDNDGCTELGDVESCGAGAACHGNATVAMCCGGAFCDDEGSLFEGDIDYIADQGITYGCGTGPAGEPEYCPAEAATRAETILMLGRAVGMSPIDQPDAFHDDDGHFAEGMINAAALHGITNGTGPGTFAPDDDALRTHAAVFLQRMYDLPNPQTDYFTDDDDQAAWAQNAHNALAEHGITSGCGANKFCGSDAITREQLAAFVRRAHETLDAPNY